VRPTIIAALCAVLAGCGAQGDSFQPLPPAATKAVVYVYRPYKLLSSQSIPMITCGHESFELDPGGYYAFREDPGQLTCAIEGSAAQYKFEAREAEQYYIEEVVDASATGSHARLVLVDASLARDEIQNCSRQGIKN
jgi:hypothetical protein